MVGLTDEELASCSTLTIQYLNTFSFCVSAASFLFEGPVLCKINTNNVCCVSSQKPPKNSLSCFCLHYLSESQCQYPRPFMMSQRAQMPLPGYQQPPASQVWSIQFSTTCFCPLPNVWKRATEYRFNQEAVNTGLNLLFTVIYVI